MSGPIGKTLLWILACVAMVLLVYEGWTLLGSVLQPLAADPEALQTDFHYYRDAATRFTATARTRLYSSSDDVIAGFAYPPPAIVPFLWMIWLPLGTALFVVTILSYLAVLGALWEWTEYLRRHGYAIDSATMGAAMVIAVASGPTYMNAVFGQVNAFVLLSAVMFISLAVIKPLESGLALALGAWLKIYPVVLAAIAVWDRRIWKALLWGAVAAVAIVILLLPVVPFGTYRTFLFDVLPARADKTAIHITNQSLVAFLERFAYPAELFLNWTGEQAVTVGPVVRSLNVIGAVVAVMFLRTRAQQTSSLPPSPRLRWASKPQASKSLALSNAGAIALIALIAPLGWGHTYVMVLPLVITQLAAMKDAPPRVALAIFACVAALMIPAGRHLPVDWAPAFIQNLVYSRYLLATSGLLLISSMPLGRTTKSTTVASA